MSEQVLQQSRTGPEPVNGGEVRAGLAAIAGRSPIFWGVLIMLLANSLWALAFIAPVLTVDTPPAEIALGRFLVFGMISLLTFRWRLVRALPRRLLMQAFLFALIGNVLYYAALAAGIRLAGAPMAILIIGMLPITIPLAGQIGRGWQPLRLIAWPLGVFFVGVVTFNLSRSGVTAVGMEAVPLLGLVLLLACLGMWTWFGVGNSRVMRDNPGLEATDWLAVIGVGALAAVVAAAPCFWAAGLIRAPWELSDGALRGLVIWSIVLGFAGTWLGGVLLNLASKLLPVTLLGQLIVFEAMFGLVYVFVISGAPPVPTEFAGMALALGGIWWSIRRLQYANAASRRRG